MFFIKVCQWLDLNADLWCRKQPVYHLSLNHCQSVSSSSHCLDGMGLGRSGLKIQGDTNCDFDIIWWKWYLVRKHLVENNIWFKRHSVNVLLFQFNQNVNSISIPQNLSPYVNLLVLVLFKNSVPIIVLHADRVWAYRWSTQVVRDEGCIDLSGKLLRLWPTQNVLCGTCMASFHKCLTVGSIQFLISFY